MPLLPFRVVAAALLGAVAASARPLNPGEPVRGWTLLSESMPDDLAVIAASPGYGINHLQLSDHIVNELRQLRDEARARRVTQLIKRAHAAGIVEVIVWDHALYNLEYYPARFRTGPAGTLDFDAPGFWDWFRADYRSLLDLAPGADGVALTFVDTGAFAEAQHSLRWPGAADKLAAVVNAVADVVVGERHLNLYARTLASSQADVAKMDAAVERIRRPEVRLMLKDTIEDFFLTSPPDPHALAARRDTLVEFDAAGEMNGQGIVANTWPEYFLGRWRRVEGRPHILGYTARTDRYGSTRLIGRPGEIDLLALAMGAADRRVTDEDVYRKFITDHYGPAAVPEVETAFRAAWDIVTSSLYTLGNCTANHSHLEYDPFDANYINYAAGKWRDPPVLRVGHGLDREFDLWRDVVDRIAPAAAKDPANLPWREVPWVLQRGWVRPGEAMDAATLRLIVAEKAFAVRRAIDALAHIDAARPALRRADYRSLRTYFEATLLTARLQDATARAYYGFRVWCRDARDRTEEVRMMVASGLADMARWAEAVRRFPDPPPAGQWDWARDADVADCYRRWITRDGWPATPGAELAELQRILPGDALYAGFDPRIRNPNAGRTFP